MERRTATGYGGAANSVEAFMDQVVRAIDVGYGNTKFVLAAEAGEARCGLFPSMTFPSLSDPTKT